MGMGKIGISWVPWDSHGNKSAMGWEWDGISRLSCRMGMGGIWALLDGKIWEWDLSFRWEWEWDGMGMKSLKWEGFVTKNLFPHISI